MKPLTQICNYKFRQNHRRCPLISATMKPTSPLTRRQSTSSSFIFFVVVRVISPEPPSDMSTSVMSDAMIIPAVNLTTEATEVESMKCDCCG
ncbi:hypothetical protein HanHA300_Chr12g0445771 [Helianthus annuus]|nr:hypothetical protein HanHA300_Chr12g0445771 [Helianthus annuus]KAJ0505503.1 hypothetical protein HanHA89_Chr12g0471271 [Helianthus annuus]KAJ0675170.1 hypothetical protein HanLR1_Chr12g0448171 [Helianthus annuus]